MKKHYITSILLFLLIGQVVLAQNKKIEIRKKSYDFGNVDNWDSPPARFTIKNNGTQPLTFLPTFQKLEVLVEFPQKPIPPNGSGEILIYYYTGEKGAFSHKIPVYSNFDAKPFNLTIKGNILSIANSALMACPGSVPEPDNTTNAHKHNIVVIDKESMHAIDNATIRIVDSNGNEDKLTAKLNGMAVIQAPTGRYVIQAEHPDYHPNERLTMLTKDKKRVVIELERKRTERPKEEPKEVLTAQKRTRTTTTTTTTTTTRTNNTQSTRTKTTQNTRTNSTQSKPRYNPPPTKTEPSQKPVDHADVYAKRKEERAKLRAKEQARLSEREAAKARRAQVKGEAKAVAEAKKREEIALSNKVAQERREREQARAEEQARQQAANRTKETNEVVEAPRTKETNAVVPPPNSTNTLSKTEYQANNIVFLIDVSQSMEENNKLVLMKNAMKRLTDVLRDIDKITVIVYSTKSEVILPSISSDNKEAVYQAIQSLEAEGSTRGIKGLETAYHWINTNFIYNGNNQIILATDGEFKDTNDQMKSAYSLVRQQMRKGILLSVVGFGQNNDAEKLMKKLAYSGKGRYINIQKEGDAEGVLIEEIKANSRK